jgi:hypothetical protein
MIAIEDHEQDLRPVVVVQAVLFPVNPGQIEVRSRCADLNRLDLRCLAPAGMQSDEPQQDNPESGESFHGFPFGCAQQ